MRLCGNNRSVHQLVQRMLPINTTKAEDRELAWNEWIAIGGCEPLLRFIRWKNGTSTEDDEILQETLITAYIKMESGHYEDRDLPFTAWLKKIAWFKIMQASRREGGQISLDDLEEYVPDEKNEHERVELWKERDALSSALAKLPPRRSHIIQLYEQGYATAEIAKLLCITKELVRKEKSLGLRQLRHDIVLAKAS
ncbi:MAG: sigma-70 family RNA polymerase sigma factor [Aggregatilineales bacterium]